MTRVMVMTFFGPRRWSDDVHPHESPPVMTVPMIVLAVGSAFSGLLLTMGGSLQNFLEPVVGEAHEEGVHAISPNVLIAITLLVVGGGVAAAVLQYGRRDVPVTAPSAVRPATVAARRDLYQDDLNEALFMRPGQYLTRSLVFADNRGVDGAVNGLAALIGGTSGRVRRMQTGFVRSYALSMLGGVIVVVGALLIVRL
jgi:NADH-quinone oxidoreductase subunit L